MTKQKEALSTKGQEITAIIQELSGHLLLSDIPMHPKDDNKLHRTSVRHITCV
ncbi:hypothetical protein M405DRAFT_809814, partial [Rhizopogon salebrosus TDB-379]